MNKNFLVLASLVLVLSQLAYADAISDAQGLRSVYQGHFDVDVSNSASVIVETLLPNQLMTILLKGSSANTTAVNAMKLPVFALSGAEEALNPRAGGANQVPSNFANFQLYIDGCNVSRQIINLCNARNCWVNNPTFPHTTNPNNPSLGSDFSMASPITLNSIDLSQCPTGTISDFSRDRKYKFEFREAVVDVCPQVRTGGKVAYQIDVINQSTAGIMK